MVISMLLNFDSKCIVHIFPVFFFFKQKTAYELRISDWSSDVCSSDLPLAEMIDLALVIVARLGLTGRGDMARFLAAAAESPPIDEHQREGSREAEQESDFGRHRRVSSTRVAQGIDLARRSFGRIGGDPFEHPQPLLEPADLPGQPFVLARQQFDLALGGGALTAIRSAALAVLVLERVAVLGANPGAKGVRGAY